MSVLPMRFRRSSQPPPWLNRRDQWRLLRLVGLLMLVVIAMRLAARPEMWAWLFPNGGSTAEEVVPAEPPPGAIDFRVRPEGRPPLREDEILSRPAEPEGDRPREEAPAGNDAAADPLGRDVFAAVQDNTLGIRSFEADAFYRVLAHVRELHPAALEEAGRDVAFTLLMVDSVRFRGAPIAVEGDLRRLQWIPVVVPEDDPEGRRRTRGIEGFYEGWLFTRESGRNPYRLVFLKAPGELDLGDHDPPARVRFTGYFFKRQGYATEGGLHTAPLLIGHRLQVLRPRTTAPRPDPSLGRMLAILAVLIAVLLGSAVWRFSVSDRRFRQRHLHRITRAPREAISALDGLETIDPRETLRQLEEAGGDDVPPGRADPSGAPTDAGRSTGG